jgi:hypothetical protein
MQETRTEHTDVGSIDLESLKLMATDPDIDVEIHGNGDVVISHTAEGQ